MTAAPFRVGLLGHGTVGSAFDALLACFTHPLQVFAVGKVAEDALSICS